MMYALGILSVAFFWVWVGSLLWQWAVQMRIYLRHRPLPNPDRLAGFLMQYHGMETVKFCYEQSVRTPAAVYLVARETVPVIRTRRAIADWWVNACREANKNEAHSRREGPYRSRQWMH